MKRGPPSRRISFEENVSFSWWTVWQTSWWLNLPRVWKIFVNLANQSFQKKGENSKKMQRPNFNRELPRVDSLSKGIPATMANYFANFCGLPPNFPQTTPAELRKLKLSWEKDLTCDMKWHWSEWTPGWWHGKTPGLGSFRTVLCI